MPPRRFSRHQFCEGIHGVDASGEDDGTFFLTDPEPFEYRDLPDSRIHTVSDGDSLQSIAETYFASFDRAAGLWWVIADFQPDPIIDPTLRLEPGRQLVIPSERVVTEQVFSETRRRVGE